MTTTIRTTFLAAVTLVASLAAVVILSTSGPAPMPVHELPRVVVTGHVQRVTVGQVHQLPRVVVTGRRTDSATAMAQAGRIAAGGV